MAEIVVMPKLGLLMETGTVSAWRANEGDEVAVGDVIAEITTEKITYELEAQAAGVLLKILLPEDGEAPVGDPIAVIGRPGEDVSAFGGAAAPAAAAGGEVVEVAPAAEGAAATPAAPAASTPVRAPGERIVATPAAKKLAADLGIDLAYVAGSGPGGRVTLEDVTAAGAAASAAAGAAPTAEPTGAAEQAAPAFATGTAKKMAADLGVDLAGLSGSGPSGRIRADDVAAKAGATVGAAPGAATAAAAGTPADIRGGVAEEFPYSGMRRLIGEHMDQSRTISPTVTYSAMADVQASKELLAQVNAHRLADDKLNITALLIKAVAACLRRMPRFNATLDGDRIKVWRSVNIGVAVALVDGLIVPVVRDADCKSVSHIGREVRDLAGRARENKLLPDEVSGGTFTVSTLGPFRSVDFFSPIINQPEAAILGVGRMKDSVVAVDGQPVVHATMGLSVTCDHRMLDGAPAAEFLRILMDYLEDPLSLLV